MNRDIFDSAIQAARNVGRLLLVGVLGLAFVSMLVWALNPDENGGVTYTGQGRVEEETKPGEEDEAATSPAEDVEPDEAEEAEEAEDTEPDPEPTPEGPSPEELIAAAADPSVTSVQVLDAGGGATRTLAIQDTLEELGYQIVNVTPSRTSVAETAIWFTEDNEAEGLALRARDPRFSVVEANERLSEGVNLHVLVGPDWQ